MGAARHLRGCSAAAATLVVVHAVTLAVTCLAAPRPAAAAVVVDDWLSGQNALLLELVAKHTEELAHLTTLVNDTRLMVATANDAAALARKAHKAYQVLRHYSVDDLARDAKAGLLRGFPELQELERELQLAVDNGRAIERGGDAFFSRVDSHDAKVYEALRRALEFGYQSSIWPMVFPESMKFKPTASPAELLVQRRYRDTGDQQRWAMQRTSMAVLAGKVRAFVEGADTKDNIEVQAVATQTQMQLQQLQNSTELLNLAQQDVALQESERDAEQAFRKQLGAAMQAASPGLTQFGGGR